MVITVADGVLVSHAKDVRELEQSEDGNEQRHADVRGRSS